MVSKIYAAGGIAAVDALGRLTVDGGTLTGSVADALCINSYTHTSSVSATGETLYTDEEGYADLTTKLSDIGITGSTQWILNDRLGNGFMTVDVQDTTTIGSLIQAWSANGIDAVIDNGILSMSSIDGRYLTGSLMEALGVGVATSSSTVNTSATSLESVYYSGTVTANTSNTLGDVGGITGSGQSVVIHGSDGTELATITTLTTNSTIQDMFDILSEYGISGTMSNGIISVYSAEGKYVDGDIISNLGITTVNGEGVTIVSGNTVTSTMSISYTSEVYADMSRYISDFITIPEDNKLYVKDSDGNSVGTISVTNTTKFEDLAEALAENDITMAMNNGVITLSSLTGKYITGEIADILGIGLNTISTGITSGIAISSSDTICIEETRYAQLTDKISDFISTTYTVTEGNGTGVYTLNANESYAVGVFNQYNALIGTVTIGTTTTFDDFFNELIGYGIRGTLTNGAVSFYSAQDNYLRDLGIYDSATGEFNAFTSVELHTLALEQMGVGVNTTSVSGTVGIAVTSANAVYVNSTVTATGSTTLSELNIACSTGGAVGNTKIYSSKTGEMIADFDLNSGMSIDQIFTALSAYGISGEINDGVISLSAVNGNYVTGSVMDALGIGVEAIGTGYNTYGTTGTSAVLVAVSPIESSSTIYTNADLSHEYDYTEYHQDITQVSSFKAEYTSMTKAEAQAAGYTCVSTAAELTSAINGSNDKIMLMKSFTYTVSATLTNKILDGNGYTITNNRGNAVFNTISNSTVQNLKVVSSGP